MPFKTTDQSFDINDTSWLAVRGGSIEAIARILSLSHQRPANWQQGMEAIAGDLGDYFECPSEWEELVCVFVTPMFRGWRLVVGNYLGAGPVRRPRDDKRNSWRKVAGWCRRLSREFGESHAFTDQAQMDWFSWILARDGAVFRQVVFEDGEFLSERGDPTGVEAKRRGSFIFRRNLGKMAS